MRASAKLDKMRVSKARSKETMDNVIVHAENLEAKANSKAKTKEDAWRKSEEALQEALRVASASAERERSQAEREREQENKAYRLQLAEAKSVKVSSREASEA